MGGGRELRCKLWDMQHLINVKMKYVKNTEAYLNLKLLHDTPQWWWVGGGSLFHISTVYRSCRRKLFSSHQAGLTRGQTLHCMQRGRHTCMPSPARLNRNRSLTWLFREATKEGCSGTRGWGRKCFLQHRDFFKAREENKLRKTHFRQLEGQNPENNSLSTSINQNSPFSLCKYMNQRDISIQIPELIKNLIMVWLAM